MHEGTGDGARRARAYKALALVLVGGAIVYAVASFAPRGSVRDAGDEARSAGTDGNQDAVEDAALRAAAADAPGSPAIGANAARRATGAGPGSRPASDDLASVVAPGQAPTMGEVITRLHDAGIHTGLGAFNPPGTSPPLIGLAVPEEYPLPPGYVRHYQATDDGQRIEPILMYAPDAVLFDAAGRRIAIPPDRVVPPELAPPGLELRPVRIPPPLDPRSPA